jgi:hypothetical protein
VEQLIASKDLLTEVVTKDPGRQRRSATMMVPDIPHRGVTAPPPLIFVVGPHIEDVGMLVG